MGLKDAVKLMGIAIIACCAVFVCTLFLNFNLDIAAIEGQISAGAVRAFYDAQVSSGKVIASVSGGCLLITSVIMLLFYIKYYIDSHRKELGILKALGYSNLKIAASFWVFGLSVFAGTVAGFVSSFLLMPTFYRIQNEDKILPEYEIHFHPALALYLVILPTVFFSLLAVLYACRKLKAPALELLREKEEMIRKSKKQKKEKAVPFLQELRGNTVRSRKTLVFFITFAAFCYSAMVQMSFCMKEVASVMFAVMVILIGVILASTTLLLATTTVIRANRKTIAMMRVFGYHQRECSKALLGGYRPLAYIGFAVGTIYQYARMKIMIYCVFKDLAGVPEFHFDYLALVITLVSFALIYEVVMYVYSEKIKKISIKEIMLE